MIFYHIQETSRMCPTPTMKLNGSHKHVVTAALLRKWNERSSVFEQGIYLVLLHWKLKAA